MDGKIWEELWWISYIVLAAWIVNGILIFYVQTQIDAIVNVQLYQFGLQFSKEWADAYLMNSRLMMVFLFTPMALSAAMLVLGFRRFKRKTQTFTAKRKTEPPQARIEDKQPVAYEKEPEAVPEEESPIPEENRAELEGQDEKPPQLECEPEHEQELEPVNEPQIGVIQPEIVQPQQESREPETVEVKDEPIGNVDAGMTISCPNCGKIFKRPQVRLDFSSGTTRLVNSCPFCNRVLAEDTDSKPEE